VLYAIAHNTEKRRVIYTAYKSKLDCLLIMEIENNRKPILIPCIWGTLIGIFVGIVFIFVATQTYCGICPHITPAEVLFPYSLIIDPSVSDWAGFLALIQWPLYGAIISFVLASLSKRKALLIICILVIIHVYSITEANRIVRDWWAPKLNSKIYVNARHAI
jgi:hypothetical protein